MSSVTSLQIDQVQRLAIYGILALLIVLFGAAGALLGLLLGALLLTFVLVGTCMIAFVFLGSSLVKLGIVAFESACRVYGGKLAHSAAQRMKTTPAQESEPIMAGPARPRTQRTSTYVPRSRSTSSSYAEFVKRLDLYQIPAVGVEVLYGK